MQKKYDKFESRFVRKPGVWPLEPVHPLVGRLSGIFFPMKSEV